MIQEIIILIGSVFIYTSICFWFDNKYGKNKKWD